ncbi:MAG: hypothetical protein OEW83_15560 [Acidimicrobiia bacterium]|nr:hypothetical protein [Acidimicrobiia bacterium]
MNPTYELLISVVVMYLVVGAAAMWYRRNQARTAQWTASPQSVENERRS